MYLAHGEYKITIKQNLLILDAKGPFNLEYVNKLIDGIAKTAPHMHKDWGQLTIFHNDSIFVPEAFNAVKDSMKARENAGLKCLAIVLVKAQCSFIIKNQITDIYQSTNLPFKFFEEVELAEQWLRERLQVDH